MIRRKEIFSKEKTGRKRKKRKEERKQKRNRRKYVEKKKVTGKGEEIRRTEGFYRLFVIALQKEMKYKELWQK